NLPQGQCVENADPVSDSPPPQRAAPALAARTELPPAFASPLAPLAPAAAPAPASSQEGAPPDAALGESNDAEDARALRLLVVDDHAINRRAIQLILQSFDCEIVMAENGLAALQACEGQVFDVVFMDVRMPELHGRETTRRLRKGGGPNAGVPVIA